MSQPSDDDRDLEAFLARESSLQARWREAAQEAPGAAIDDAVRAAARRAVHAGPRAGRPPQSARWRVPLALAATVVIGSSLTLMLARHEPPLPAEEGPAASSAPATQFAAPPTADAPPAAAAKVAPPETAREEAAPPETAPPETTQAEAAPPRTMRKEAPPATTMARDTARPATARPPAPTPAGNEPADERKTEPVRTREPRSLPAPSTNADGAAAPEADAPGAASSPDPAAASDAAPSAGPAPAASPAPSAAQSDAGDSAALNSPAPPTPHGMRERHPNLSSAPTLHHRDQDAARSQWIERIRALWRAGRTDEAARSLRDFRARYPDYPLPEDLKHRLQDPSAGSAPGRR